LNEFFGNDKENRPKRKKNKIEKEEDEPPCLSLRKEFLVKETLGKGSFSVVKKIIRKYDNKPFAVKVYKSGNTFPTARGEAHILKFLKHPGVIDFHKFYLKGNAVRSKNNL
jgi:serine/threonine protein kinase